jgi:hypothetical protein
MGVELSRQQAETLILLVRHHVAEHKRPPEDRDLRRFYTQIEEETTEWVRQ